MQVNKKNLEKWISDQLGISVKDWHCFDLIKLRKTGKTEAELVFFRELIHWIVINREYITKDNLELWMNKQLDELIEDCRTLKESKSTKKYGSNQKVCKALR